MSLGKGLMAPSGKVDTDMWIRAAGESVPVQDGQPIDF